MLFGFISYTTIILATIISIGTYQKGYFEHEQKLREHQKNLIHINTQYEIHGCRILIADNESVLDSYARIIRQPIANLPGILLENSLMGTIEKCHEYKKIKDAREPWFPGDVNWKRVFGGVLQDFDDFLTGRFRWIFRTPRMRELSKWIWY